MDVEIGTLNKRITIVQVEREQDPDGYGPGKDSNVLTCWASFRRISARELMDKQADYAEVMARFLIRTPIKKKITRKMVVLYAGERYEIVYPNDYGDSGQFTELLCRLMTKKE